MFVILSAWSEVAGTNYIETYGVYKVTKLRLFLVVGPI